MSIPRTLSLHESALSSIEYAAYVPLFHELLEPGEPGVPAREARGWLKGRYLSLDPITIDKILRLFHPAMTVTDTLSEGQFFAVLRLLNHVQAGSQVDPSLIFIQPKVVTPSVPTSAAVTPKADVNSTTHNSNNPFTFRPSSKPTTPSKPLSNSALSSDEGSVPEFVRPALASANSHSRASSSPAPSVQQPNIINPPPNPFLARTNSIPQHPGNAAAVAPVGPPLPPRRPSSFLPPPRHASQQQSVASGSNASNSSPLSPPKPPKSLVSPLIERSLMAAKGAQRSAEIGLEKVRTWEVIKTSSPGVSETVANLEASRVPSSPPPRSTSSFDQVASAKIPSTTRHMRNMSLSESKAEVSLIDAEEDSDSPFASSVAASAPTSNTTDSVFTPLAATRVGRSKSLHSGSVGGSPPLPPPRRKRPESVQLSPSIESSTSTWGGAPSPITETPFSDSKAPIIPGAHVTPVLALGRQIQSSIFKSRPGMETARAKVEGKLIPGGYGKWGAEGLLSHENGTNAARNQGPIRSTAVFARTPATEMPRARPRSRPGSDPKTDEDYFEDAEEGALSSGSDDVRRNGWKPLKG